MNFDEDKDCQRAISSGSESLNEKISSSPVSYSKETSQRRRRKRGSQQSAPAAAAAALEEDRHVEINTADVLCGRSKKAFNHGRYWDVA